MAGGQNDEEAPAFLSTHLARRALEQILPEGWYVHSQDAITLATSEPEPDVAMVRGDRRAYVDHHPGPKDVALVVEVADASLQRDRGFKRRLYAQAGIPAYWIVNLVDRVLEVYTEPSGPTDQPDYRQQRTFGAVRGGAAGGRRPRSRTDCGKRPAAVAASAGRSCRLGQCDCSPATSAHTARMPGLRPSLRLPQRSRSRSPGRSASGGFRASRL